MNDLNHARRRLLPGTFLAPAVMLISSGSAIAATSTSCMARLQKNPQTAAVVDGQFLDTYVRVQLHQHADGSYWLAGDDIFQSNLVDPGRYTRFFIDVNQLSTDPSEINQIKDGMGFSNKWVALRFDSSGRIVGVGADVTGSAAAASCLASF